MKQAERIQELKKKINNKKARIAVVGLGYVGLPLALAFTKRGFRVLGVDVDKDRIAKIKRGVSYITDVSSQELKSVSSKALFSSGTDFGVITTCDAVIICVPTPLRKKYYPDISFILNAVHRVKKFLKPGHLIVLESTTYPGTTKEEILPILEESGLSGGKDFYLAFSPERIDPGNIRFPVHKIPKVIGGVSQEATTLAGLLYSRVVEKIIPVSSSRVAEAVKLLENTFRIVNIALVDELAMMCHNMGLNIWEVIEAAKTKPFGFMPFYPGPGLGGHCIPKDPLYLYWIGKKFGFSSRFIRLSSEITSSMPAYVVDRVARLLSKKRKRIQESRILVIGVTYKKDVHDLRKSPALDVIELLKRRRARVSYYDPLIPYLTFNSIDLKSVDLKKARLGVFDCVVITTDHSNIDYQSLLERSRLIFDTRNVYPNVHNPKIHRL